MLNSHRPLFKAKPRKPSEKGMALIEAIPVLFLMAIFFNISLGFFGAIHSGILNSIASYNYTIETFRFRSNLMYFRPGSKIHFKSINNRVHATIKEAKPNPGDNSWPTTVRPIAFNYSKSKSRSLAGIGQSCDTKDCRSYEPDNAGTVWSRKSTEPPPSGETLQTPRIWVKTVYGICLNAECKSSN